MYVSVYHKILRVSALVVMLMLVFDSGLILPLTKQLSDNTLQFLANSSVGMFASVPENELNSLSAQLEERDRALDEREREIAARDYASREKTDYSTYILSSILFILTTLIIFNYAMDWKRERKLYYEKQAT